MTITAMPRLLFTVALTAGLATVGVACSDDDDDTADPAPTSAAPATVVADPDDPYCDVERRIDAIFGEAFGALGEDATEDQANAAGQQASQRVVDEGLLDEADDTAPDAIRDDLDVLIASVRAAAGGDVAAFQTEESDAAGARVDAYCGLSD